MYTNSHDRMTEVLKLRSISDLSPTDFRACFARPTFGRVYN